MHRIFDALKLILLTTLIIKCDFKEFGSESCSQAGDTSDRITYRCQIPGEDQGYKVTSCTGKDIQCDVKNEGRIQEKSFSFEIGVTPSNYTSEPIKISVFGKKIQADLSEGDSETIGIFPIIYTFSSDEKPKISCSNGVTAGKCTEKIYECDLWLARSQDSLDLPEREHFQTKVLEDNVVTGSKFVTHKKVKISINQAFIDTTESHSFLISIPSGRKNSRTLSHSLTYQADRNPQITCTQSGDYKRHFICNIVTDCSFHKFEPSKCSINCKFEKISQKENQMEFDVNLIELPIEDKYEITFAVYQTSSHIMYRTGIEFEYITDPQDSTKLSCTPYKDIIQFDCNTNYYHCKYITSTRAIRLSVQTPNFKINTNGNSGTFKDSKYIHNFRLKVTNLDKSVKGEVSVQLKMIEGSKESTIKLEHETTCSREQNSQLKNLDDPSPVLMNVQNGDEQSDGYSKDEQSLANSDKNVISEKNILNDGKKSAETRKVLQYAFSSKNHYYIGAGVIVALLAVCAFLISVSIKHRLIHRIKMATLRTSENVYQTLFGLDED